MNTIPQNYTDFLFWIKETTEAFWNIDPKNSQADFKCEDWQYGAKWLPLSDIEIDEIEQKYSVCFPPEHREFLRILHTIDRNEIYETEDFNTGKIKMSERPYFYNWLTDENEIQRRLRWPFDTIWQDVKGSNGVWLKSWGTRPDSEEQQKIIFSDWLSKAPTLLPISGHRFSAIQSNSNECAILSVYGSDIIVYGWTFKYHLLNLFSNYLGLSEMYFDEEDNCSYAQSVPELEEYFQLVLTSRSKREIQSWKEMILIWSSGWSSFGLEWPYPEGPRPIVMTYSPDGDSHPKYFKDFE